MLLINFLISILTIFFSGIIILRLLNFKEQNLFESLVLSFGLGAGFIGLTMFFLSLTEIPFSLGLVILPQLFLFFAYLRKFKLNFKSINNKVSFKLKWNFSFFELILINFILFEVFYVLLEAGSGPFIAWDAWCTWGFKAKMLFIDKTFYIKEWLSSPNIPHLNYPLLLSLQETYIYIFLGRIYEPLARIFCSFYFIGLIFYFYGSLRIEFTRRLSLIACFFLSTTPILLKESVSGYADVPLAFYLALAVINLWHYIKIDKRERLWLSCIFLGLSMWVKNEGTSLWLAIIISLILFMLLMLRLFKQKAKLLLFYIFIPWIIFSPWMILRLIFNLRDDKVLFRPINTFVPIISERLLPILKFLFFELININRWNIFWIIFLFLMIHLIILKRKTEFLLIFVILFQSLFFISVMIFGANDLAQMSNWCRTSLHRPLLQLYPIALFFIAQCLGLSEFNSRVSKKFINE